MRPFFLHSRENPEVTGPVVEALQGALMRLAEVAAGLGVLIFVWMAASYPDIYRWNILPPFLALWAAWLAVLLLRERSFITAQALWLLGLAAVAPLAMLATQRPEPIFILVLLPLLGGVMSGGAWALAGAGLALLGLVLAAGLPDLLPLPEGYPQAVAVAGIFSGLAGWAASSSLISIIEWSLFSYGQAQNNLEDVRSHRAQLDRARKDLDSANYRLQRANTDLVAAWRAANEAERFKTEFVTNVSHELRTPLNLITGFSEVMVNSPESYGGVELPGPYRPDIHAIYHSARHLLALVDDVLDLGRIEANKVSLVTAEVSVEDLVGEVDGMVRDYIAAKGLDFQVSLAPGLPFLRIDRLRIRQVLLNLMVNAARFTESGSIRLEALLQDEEVLFKVRDTGKGISGKDLPHIFEPFHSIGNLEESPWHSGTGLGLPISKKFVEMHHGQMGVDSVPMHGSTFWFSLPCQTCRVAPEFASGEHPAARLADPSEHAVLVRAASEGLTAALQRRLSGFRLLPVVPAGLPAQAIETHAAVLICDTPFPPEDLPANMALITLDWPLPGAAAAHLGGDDLLVKPVAPSDLLTAAKHLAPEGGRVLIADADPELVRLFRRSLRPRFAPPDVLEAYSGEEAVQLAEAERPVLAIVDPALRGPGGASAAALLRANPALAGMPILLVSATAWEDLDLRLAQPLSVTRHGGLAPEEAARILQAVLNVLSERTPVPEDSINPWQSFSP